MTVRIRDHYPAASSTGLGSRRVECDTETLLCQAPMTAHEYMRCALVDIDELLGEGYAKAHPELVAAYMQTAAIDFATGSIARAIEALGDAVDTLRPRPDLHVVSQREADGTKGRANYE